MSIQARKLGGILGKQVHQSEKTITLQFGTKICTYIKQSKKIIHEIDQFENDLISFNISNNWVFALDNKGSIKSFNFDPESQQIDKLYETAQQIKPVFTFNLNEEISSGQFDLLNERLFYSNKNGDIKVKNTQK